MNCEQCNTPTELSVQAQAALAATSTESVTGMVESYSIHFCAVLALKGLCLNAHRSVKMELRRGVRTSEEISHAREGQAESLQRFVQGTRELFALSLRHSPQSYREWITQSLSLIRMLPPGTHEHPERLPLPGNRLRQHRTFFTQF
jgi:hypothetical protein